MTGETNLAVLLQSMTPVLHEGEYVFCTIADTSQLVSVAAYRMLVLFGDK